MQLKIVEGSERYEAAGGVYREGDRSVAFIRVGLVGLKPVILECSDTNDFKAIENLFRRCQALAEGMSFVIEEDLRPMRLKAYDEALADAKKELGEMGLLPKIPELPTKLGDN